jgi:hypothetical protein
MDANNSYNGHSLSNAVKIYEISEWVDNPSILITRGKLLAENSGIPSKYIII